MKHYLSICLSCLDPNIWVEMKCSLSLSDSNMRDEM